MKARSCCGPRDGTINEIRGIKESAGDEQVQGLCVIQGKISTIRDPQVTEGVILPGIPNERILRGP